MFLTTKIRSQHLGTLDVSAPLGGHNVLAPCLFSVQPGGCTTSVAQNHTSSAELMIRGACDRSFKGQDGMK